MLNLKQSVPNAIKESFLVFEYSVLQYKILIWPTTAVAESQMHSKAFSGLKHCVDSGCNCRDDGCVQIFHTNKADY